MLAPPSKGLEVPMVEPAAAAQFLRYSFGVGGLGALGYSKLETQVAPC